MANTPNHPAPPEDDSWGKIASDLFGIQFNDDDDFDLPDDDAPTKAQPVAEVTSTPAAAPTLAEAFEAAELDEPADEPEPAKSTASGDEDRDEFWDILESWNWDETAKPAAASRRSEEPRGGRPRQDLEPAEPRRSRSEDSPRRDQREERRPEKADRPRRRDAEPAAGSGDEERPPRSSREEGRRERPPRAEKPSRSRRPDDNREKSERPPRDRGAEHRRPKESAPQNTGDDFGAGVEETVEPPRSKHQAPPRRREETPAPVRKPKPQRRSSEVDEFAGDLFVDDLEEELIEDESFDSEVAEVETVVDAEDEGGEERPRRPRRRRRRRGRRPAAESGTTSDVEFDEESAPEEVGFDADEEEVVDSEVAEEEVEQEEERDRKRSRRRRRRRGRRPGTPSSSVEADDIPSSRADEDEDDENSEVDESELTGEDDEEEAFVPVSYEGIPTWEEAISYLVIVPPSESRGHHRGRGDGHRRDDSRRR